MTSQQTVQVEMDIIEAKTDNLETKTLLLRSINTRATKLLALIDAHDCHLSPHDGCTCAPLWKELIALKMAGGALL